MAQGLGVRHPAPSYPARDWFGTVDSHWPYASRPASSSRPRRRTESDGSRTSTSHTRSASNLLDQAQSSLAPRTAHGRSASNSLDCGRRQLRSAAQSQNRSQEIAELIEFFRTYDPPSESWTSQPFDDAHTGRWSRIKNMGGFVKRSKSVPKLSRTIQLPDSAISGTTTGGHRHIAISIPMEASPFGLMPRSQYPVYHHTVASHLLDPGSPIRYLNEKGVITVLRPVTENSRPHYIRGSFPGFQRSIPPCPGPPPSKALPPAGLRRTRSGSTATSRASIGISPQEADELTGRSDQDNESRSDLRNKHSLPAPPQRTSSAFGLHPRPPVNISHRPSMARPSIDGVIASNAPPANQRKPTSISESSATEDEEPILGNSDHWSALKLASGQVEHSATAGNDNKIEAGGATLIRENPLATMAEQETPPPTPRTTESRREKVRNLKRRDMASIRNGGHQQDSGSNKSPDSAADNVPEVSSAQNIGKAEEYISANTFSPIMVVTSIEPEEPIESGRTRTSWNERKRKDLEITPPGTGFVTKVEKTRPVESGHESDDSHANEENKTQRTPALTIPQARRARARASLSPLRTNTSCNPTPPLSPTRTPRRANSTLDRISLSRRREWNSSKCRTRRVQDVVEALKSKMQDDAVIIEAQREEHDADRDREFLNLYEAYREHRLRDMERRVRRLERHGDVWMRALVPVLDNVNRTMATRKNASGMDEIRKRQADKNTTNGAGRSERRHRSLPLYSMNKEESADQQPSSDSAKDEADDLEGTRQDSDDSELDSGLDNLEPLMRELAGAAKERLRKAEHLTGIAL